MRKRSWLNIVLILLFPLVSFSQTQYPNKKVGALGVHFTLHDFKSGTILKNEGLSELLIDGQYKKVGDMGPGLALSFTKGLTDNLDYMARFGIGFVSYPLPNKPLVRTGSKALTEADISLNFKLTSDRYWVSPFLSAGLGASQWSGYWGAYSPMGVGLQVNMWNETFAFIQAQYRLPLTSNTNNHLFYSIGFAGTILKKKELPPPPPPPIPTVEAPKDSDGDGIIDAEDACPTVAGLAQYKGCPDTDKDNIPDNEDKCPTVPGTAKYNGCPVPDSDNDGINDEEDECPTVAGLARYRGCPVPDRDKDGINDEEDRCPDIPGVAENGGCPVIEKSRFDGSKVIFATGSATLTSAGKKELDKGIKIVKEEYPNVNINIEGHTDNIGSSEFNQKLSLRRAESVRKYLISKGIDASRLTTTGVGEEHPIEDNKTAKGRAQNRRVVFSVSQ